MRDSKNKFFGNILMSLNWGKEFSIKTFNMRVKIIEGFFSKAQSTFFDTASIYGKILFGEKSFETAAQTASEKKVTWNQSFNLHCELEEVILFKFFDKDTFTDDDPIGSADIKIEQIRNKKNLTKDLTLRGKKGKMLGSVKINVETDLEVVESPSKNNSGKVNTSILSANRTSYNHLFMS